VNLFPETVDFKELPIGGRIARVRENRGLSQQSLADAVGISQSSVADIESGKTQSPRNPTLSAIGKILNSSLGLDWLEEELKNRQPTGFLTFDEMLDAKIRKIVGEMLESKEQTESAEVTKVDQRGKKTVPINVKN
jgi:transcriptional regulator with XRE-family HTH domain